MEMTPPVLTFENVAMAFKGRTLFAGLNLNVLSGQILGIMGPSGTGKSTVLKLAAGLLSPLEGRITYGAGPVGYVFQEPRLIPWYTALENIRLVLTARGIAPGHARQIAGQALAQFGLESFENHYPGQLSGGMKQRVSIARALSVTPELLLLDEPFTGLDTDLKKQVMETIGQTAEQNQISIIHVTHAKEELLPATRDVCVLTRHGFSPGPVK